MLPSPRWVRFTQSQSSMGSFCQLPTSPTRKSSKIAESVTSLPVVNGFVLPTPHIPHTEILKNRRICHLAASRQWVRFANSPRPSNGNPQKSQDLSPLPTHSPPHLRLLAFICGPLPRVPAPSDSPCW